MTAAFAKHVGQRWLHLFVRSISASAVELLCSGQRPQSKGQPLSVFVSVIPALPSYRHFENL